MRKAILFLIIFALIGCDKPAKVPEEPVSEARYSQTGTVIETIDVVTYTYIHLDNQGSKIWVASNPVSLSVGDVVGYSDAIIMNNFYSKVLDRTFESILFVSDVVLTNASVADSSAGQAASPQVSDPHKNLKTQIRTNPKPVFLESVNLQALEGGTTIAIIFAEHEQIDGQEVSLRGKVIKFSPSVLGKNWVTLQDGTGTAPDNSLVVTSLETVAVGDEVIVRGRVKSNVDIGAGYTYKVLLEGASFEK